MCEFKILKIIYSFSMFNLNSDSVFKFLNLKNSIELPMHNICKFTGISAYARCRRILSYSLLRVQLIPFGSRVVLLLVHGFMFVSCPSNSA